MLRQWLNTLVNWFIYYLCLFIFGSNGVHLSDTWRCNRNIKSRIWRIPELCKFIYEKYGKLVYIKLLGQRVLIVTDLKVASSLMTNNGHNLKQRFGNQFGLRNLNMFLTGLIWNNDVQQWKHNRNIFETTLKMGSKNLEALAFCHLENLEKTALQIAEPITVLELLRNFTLSMTMEGLFEIPMPTDDNIYDWREVAKTTVANYFKAWEFYLLNPNSYNLVENEVHESSCRKMLEFSEEIYSRSDKVGNSNFISNLSHFNDTNGILQCIAEMLLAGTDTSSITMFYTLLFLADYPEIANKISAKIHSESQKRVDRDISYLYYESMRLIPVGPVILRQCEIDIKEGDVCLNKGDGIIFNIAGMNRVYYDQPDKFNPNRYDSECFPLSFGVGKKSCVGKTFAEREMKLFFTWFLKKYTVMGHREEMIGLLRTRWDVANAPVADIKLTIFPRKVIYFVGQHGTGKTRLLDTIKAAYPKLKIMRKEEILTSLKLQYSTQQEHATFRDLQIKLINAHSEILATFKTELVLIESSMLDSFIDLKMKIVSHGYDEKELLRPMKKCLVVYFPILSEKYIEKNKEYLNILERLGGRYHSLKTISESDRYKETMNFIRESSSPK